MFISLTRILRSGWLNFWRNLWLSVATISVMMLALLVITGLLILSIITDTIVTALQEKVDISVYFNTSVSEEDILGMRSDLLGFKEVKDVEYISREEALTRFKERHKDNLLIQESLRELGENPLEASLNIKANQASQYETIASFLEASSYNSFIDKINYRQNQEMISRLFSITGAVKKAGIILSVILGFVAVLVAFNTVRLAIYSSRDEISIMKLVGASNWFIHGPFLVQGALSGAFAALVTITLSFLAIAVFSSRLSGFIPGLDLLSYFKTNALYIVGLELAIGVVFGVLSSFIAMRRYLKI